LGLLFFRLSRILAAALLALSRRLRFNASLTSGASTLAAASLTFVIPALALADWQFRARFMQPPPPAHHPAIPLLGQSGVRHGKIGPITRYLIDHARIVPGAPFRGYTATYLVDPQGPVQEQLQKRSAPNKELSKLEVYVAARPYFDQHYQNRLQETDLWEHNIPTLQDYGQWITRFASLGMSMLFDPNGKPTSGRLRFLDYVFLQLHGLNLDLLPLLGLRYLITDIQLHDARATLRAEQSSAGYYCYRSVFSHFPAATPGTA
jgi:hypothetical protein